jgi:hypothetical protein
VLICGIYWLSIAIIVLVDTLVADNSDELEEKVRSCTRNFGNFVQR